MSDDLKQEDLINIRSMNSVRPKGEPVVDKLVSEAVGKTVYTNNITLIKKIAEWKSKAGVGEGDIANPMMDNFLDDPAKVAELKECL